MALPRFIQPGSFYHIIARGNNKQNIFLQKRDYIRYLRYLDKYCQKFSTKVIAFCLMPNHVHLSLKEGEEAIIARFIHDLHTAYSMYFNLKHHRSGHLFQGPFRDSIIEQDEYLTHLSRYIHLNPSSASLVKKPEHWSWSSYKHYLGEEKLSFVNKDTVLKLFSQKNPGADYRNFVESRIDYQKQISFQKLVLE